MSTENPSSPPSGPSNEFPGSSQSDNNTNNNAEYTASTDLDYRVDLGETYKNTRKRKLDDEGFVTPATPDIPKSSSKYEMPAESDYMEYYNFPKEGTNDDSLNEENPLYKDAVYKSAADLIKDIAEESKMSTLRWSSELCESENFESFCVSRLERLITDARNLEENLKQQKELLRKRLGFISRTLQHDV